MENLKERQWPSRELIRLPEFNWNKDGHCTCCNKKLEKYDSKYFGIISDCCTLYDFELSYETNYCEECAKRKAKKTRNEYHPTCPPVISHTDNIIDDGHPCERKVYGDGSVVESTADSIKAASIFW